MKIGARMHPHRQLHYILDLTESTAKDLRKALDDKSLDQCELLQYYSDSICNLFSNTIKYLCSAHRDYLRPGD